MHYNISILYTVRYRLCTGDVRWPTENWNVTKMTRPPSFLPMYKTRVIYILPCGKMPRAGPWFMFTGIQDHREAPDRAEYARVYYYTACPSWPWRGIYCARRWLKLTVYFCFAELCTEINRNASPGFRVKTEKLGNFFLSPPPPPPWLTSITLQTEPIISQRLIATSPYTHTHTYTLLCRPSVIYGSSAEYPFGGSLPNPYRSAHRIGGGIRIDSM